MPPQRQHNQDPWQQRQVQWHLPLRRQPRPQPRFSWLRVVLLDLSFCALILSVCILLDIVPSQGLEIQLDWETALVTFVLAFSTYAIFDFMLCLVYGCGLTHDFIYRHRAIRTIAEDMRHHRRVMGDVVVIPRAPVRPFTTVRVPDQCAYHLGGHIAGDAAARGIQGGGLRGVFVSAVAAVAYCVTAFVCAIEGIVPLTLNLVVSVVAVVVHLGGLVTAVVVHVVSAAGRLFRKTFMLDAWAVAEVEDAGDANEDAFGYDNNEAQEFPEFLLEMLQRFSGP